MNKHTDEKVTNAPPVYTVTGRLVTNHVEPQNIPIRTELGHKIREAFVPLVWSGNALH